MTSSLALTLTHAATPRKEIFSFSDLTEFSDSSSCYEEELVEQMQTVPVSPRTRTKSVLFENLENVENLNTPAHAHAHSPGNELELALQMPMPGKGDECKIEEDITDGEMAGIKSCNTAVSERKLKLNVDNKLVEYDETLSGSTSTGSVNETIEIARNTSSRSLSTQVIDDDLSLSIQWYSFRPLSRMSGPLRIVNCSADPPSNDTIFNQMQIYQQQTLTKKPYDKIRSFSLEEEGQFRNHSLPRWHQHAPVKRSSTVVDARFSSSYRPKLPSRTSSLKAFASGRQSVIHNSIDLPVPNSVLPSLKKKRESSSYLNLFGLLSLNSSPPKQPPFLSESFDPCLQACKNFRKQTGFSKILSQSDSPKSRSSITTYNLDSPPRWSLDIKQDHQTAAHFYCKMKSLITPAMNGGSTTGKQSVGSASIELEDGSQTDWIGRPPPVPKKDWIVAREDESEKDSKWDGLMQRVKSIYQLHRNHQV